jgi:DNA-binding NtrC family response regulator
VSSWAYELSKRGKHPKVNPHPGTHDFSAYTHRIMKGNRTAWSVEPAGTQARCQSNAPKRILVVDDDEVIRQVNAEMLSRLGYETETAQDGAAAWDALQANGYDLLITDNNMPKVSGVELIKKLRSAHMTLPVVLASGTIPTEAMNWNSSLQLAAMLLKPFTMDELLVTVEKIFHAADRAGEQSEPMPIRRGKPSVDGLWLR